MFKALDSLTFPGAHSSPIVLTGESVIQKNYTDLFMLMLQRIQDYAIFTLDTKGVITSWNLAAQYLFGYTAKEAVGKSLAMLFPEMVKSGHLQKDIEIAIKKGQYEHITETVNKNKKKIFIRCIVTALWGNDNKLKGFSKIVVDITQQIEIEKKREEFLSLAGHELKTPIASIKAYLQLLQMKLSKRGDSELAPIITNALSQVDMLSRLLQDILDTSRIAIGKLPFHNTDTIYIDEFLQEVIDAVQVTNHDHKIVFEKRAHLQLIHVDKARLKQLITNLLLNAIKYSPKHKTVIVSIKKDKDTVTISVQDKGIGIAKKNQANIFEKFYREDEAKKFGTGLGLGLHLAKEIVEHYKGEILVKSQKGKGSTFSIVLPQSLTVG